MNLKRRLRQIIDSKIPEYYYKRYPYLIQFIYGFVDFIDQECAKDIMNLTENLDPDKINDKFLDDYFEQYCKNLIDPESYQLTDENKRLFLSISKLLYNNKGKKLSFDIALKYLTRFFVYSDDNYVETLDYELIEDAENWYSYRWYPPGSGTPQELAYRNAFTYTIEGDFRRSLIASMIEQLNPVGFGAEYRFPMSQTEEFHVADALEVALFNVGPINTEIYYQGDTLEVYDVDTLFAPKIIEEIDVSTKPFRYDGRRKYNGTRKYDGKDTGIFETYSIVASELGVPYDTFEKLTE